MLQLKILHFNLCWGGFILFHFDTLGMKIFCTVGVGVDALKYNTVPIHFSLSYFTATVNFDDKVPGASMIVLL